MLGRDDPISVHYGGHDKVWPDKSETVRSFRWRSYPKPLHFLLRADATYWACRTCVATGVSYASFRDAYRRAWDHWWLTHVKQDHP